MISAKLAGAVILGVPLIVLAWAMLWRRQRPAFFFALALILVALGYLAATGATDDIARKVAPGMVAAPGGSVR
jgi:hypothetical protein